MKTEAIESCLESAGCMPDTEDAVADARAELEALKTELAKVTALAYIGDHHFDDLTWKARCEEAVAELTRLRALLASGQCVDLARLGDIELGSKLFASTMPDATHGAKHRAWLIEKAGVKA